MSQTGFGTNIDATVETGNALTSRLNLWSADVDSTNLGSGLPSYLEAGMLHVNTSGGASAWVLGLGKDNSTSIPLITIDTVALSISFGTITGPQLIREGAGNSAVAPTNSDTLKLAGVGNTGLAIMAPNASKSAVYMGSVANPSGGWWDLDHNTQAMTLGTNRTGGTLALYAGSHALALHIDASKRVSINHSTPDSGSFFHAQKASTGTTFSSLIDDFIVEGTGDFGMCVISSDAGIARFGLGSPSDPLGAGMYFNPATNLAQLGGMSAGIDTQIIYGASKVGIHIDNTDDRLGIFNTAPENMVHIGDAMYAPFAGTLAGTQVLQVVQTGFTRMYIEGEDAAGFNMVATNAGTDKKLYSVDNNDGNLNFMRFDDDLGATHLYMRMRKNASAEEIHFFGDVYMTDIKGGVTLNLKIDNTGKIIAV